MSDQTDAGFEDYERVTRLEGKGWIVLLWLTAVVATMVSDRPQQFGGPLDTMLLFGAVAVLLAGGTLVLSDYELRWSWGRTAAAIGALASWTLLMLVDDKWSLTTFALYAVCYSFRMRVGLAMAAHVSVVWAAAMLLHGAPFWVVVMPLGVFTVSSILAFTIQRVSELNTRQTELISELRATQRDLVASERTKGVLAERTRMAAEIHDTLAQGFTSIVLLSRAGMRSGDATEALKTIEETAQENLADARRLVEAIRPPELGAGSLPMALERQLASTLPDEVDRHFAVEGDPRSMTGAVEVTVLRAAQEALLNIRTHANADRVDMILRFTDESVTLDVRDDGVGFTIGDVSDRGTLTGGQGLALLRRRVESLSGELRIGPRSTANGAAPDSGRGSQIVLTLPVAGV